MKITIIGTSGSGKSTLSRKISETFKLPRVEIDRIWFKHDGHKYLNGTVEEKEVVMNKVTEEIKDFLSKNENWVIDGTYSKIQPLIADKADFVIHIKRSLLRRILSHIKRVMQGNDRHPEVTKMQDLMFIRTIVKRWRKRENKKLETFTKQYTQKLVVLKDFKEIDTYFESLKTSK
jgi:adenylate kinase family enzyme